jgi:hypothetical protein
MGFAKWLIVLAALGFGYHLWQQHQAHALMAGVSASPGGFVPTAMPDGVQPDTVLILAPVNCPSDAARRADALADELKRMGVPAVRGDRFALSVANPSDEQKAEADRAVAVLNGTIPAVFVNGMGKANPSAQEVADEWRRTGRH